VCLYRGRESFCSAATEAMSFNFRALSVPL
jgi:hypothetical protein